jgi:hypothetical protein
VLQNNGGDDLAIDPLGATTFVFATRLAVDAEYLVTVAANPPTEVCSVSNDAGTMPAADVENVAVVCACRPLLDNCNGEANDGCETALDTLTDCGGCGNPCDVANGMPTCSTGTCEVQTCTAPFDDCNASPVDGCESDVTTDVNNCSGCGTVCIFDNAAATCASSSCVMGACNTNFGDCNGLPDDGCEANWKNDDAHCGACNQPCGPGTSCKGGTCKP